MNTNGKINVMNKIIVILFLFYTLSACQSTAVNSSDNLNLETQYSEHNQTNKLADINTQLGAGYIANGRYDRALVKLNKAIDHDSNYALAHNYLGVLYGRIERPREAEKEFKKSIQLSPNDTSLLNNYAVFLCDDKQFERAQTLFKKVLNNPLYIKRAQAYQSAGWCALENNKLELAEKLYKKSVAMDANMPASLIGLAKLYYKQSNYEYAWSYFERYSRTSVLDADALWLGINLLRKISYPDKNILSTYELKLKSKYPDSDEAKNLYQGKQEY